MTTETATQENPNMLGMSDEELMQMSTPPALVASTEEVTPVEEVVPVSEEVVAPVVAEEVLDGQESQNTESTETVTAESAVEAEKVPETPAVDYKAEYDKIFTPFKANGKEIAVTNADDAIALMQMGANYNKKMAALKPNLKLMKLLENNGLLSEEKISYLIDLEKKDPTAISKLVKDSGLDHMDLDIEKANEYTPKTYKVDDREMELDAVLDEIQGTPAYNRTLDIVSTKWDGPSKQVIAESPQLLKVINGHVESGIYDIISKAVESERMFGRLNGLSDIEAYRQVGDAIQSRGGFNAVVAPPAKPAATVIAPPTPRAVNEDKLREKRRAASSTKPAGSNVPSSDFNPLSMSDEEFSKTVNSKYL